MSGIALIGAAGAIGRSVAEALRSQGKAYRVVGRDREKLQATFGVDPLAEIVSWNPDDPASVRSAVRGMETLVYLVGVPYDQFQLHPVLMRKTLDGAVAEGVQRVVLVGTVYPYGMPVTRPVSESHPREPQTFKGKMRKEQEDVLLTVHRDGKIQGTVLRLPDFFGPDVEKSLLHSLFQAAAKGGTANLIGPIDAPHEFLYAPDAGPVVFALAAKSEAYGKWWNLGGPGVTTQRDLAGQAFTLAGRKPKIRAVGKSTLRIMGLFSPIMREFVEMNYLQTNPVLLDDSALYSLLGNIHKTSYADAIRATLEAYQRTNTP
jgi:nucleoside-diphosphate-sugar epimerase